MVLGLRETHGWHRGSVLPTIPLEQSKDGVRVVALPPPRKEAVMVGCLLLMLVGMILMLIFVANPSRAWGAAVSVFMLAAAIFEVTRQWLIKRKLARATLLVRPWPLRLGQRATIRFENRMRTRSNVDGVSARLVSREETTHSRGKYQTVRKHERYELSLDVTNCSIERGRVRGEWTIDIPADGLPSFSVESNKLSWRVETKTRTDGVEVPADFELLVVPELA